MKINYNHRPIEVLWYFFTYRFYRYQWHDRGYHRDSEHAPRQLPCYVWEISNHLDTHVLCRWAIVV